MRFFDSAMRAALVLLMCYVLAIGGTFTGLAVFEFRVMSLVVLALVFGAWLIGRWRRGWMWHITALDVVLVFWALAFGLSLLANLDVWRRVVMGLWFAGLYAGVWYLLHDALANRGIRREMLVDALLFGGVVVLFFACWQTYSWLVLTGFSGGLPRPVSVLGNANTLGAFLAVLLPFIVGRWAAVRSRLARGVLAGYGLLTAAMLFLTFSRGGWVGASAGLVVWFGLMLWARDLLSVARLRAWFGGQDARTKAVAAGGVTLALVAGLLMTVLIVRSFDMRGRDLGLRTYLFEAALGQFSERPLTGYGLFTFGRHLSRFASMPDVTAHSHAHNVPLHIAAELGIPGLIALAATLFVLARMVLRNIRRVSEREQAAVIGGAGAVVAFGVHHLLDVPSMMPAIALVGLVALVVAAAPVEPARMTARWRLAGHPVGMALLPVALLVSGGWSTAAYGHYMVGLSEAHGEGDYRAAAGMIGTAIEADPALSLYHAQQAFVLGMANSTGDLHAGLEAIAIYEQLITMEPYYAPYRANLAALYWNTGRQEAGLVMMEMAAELAPEAWQLWYDAGLYAEALGDAARAEAAYARALIANPDADLHPAWGQTAVQARVTSDLMARSPRGQMAVLLAQGALEDALAVWESEADGTTSSYVLRALIALAQGEREAAVNWLARAEHGVNLGDAEAWLQLGAARLALFDGAVPEVIQLAERGALDADYQGGSTRAYAQFLRQGIARQFLPQVYYPTTDPVLLFLTGTP